MTSILAMIPIAPDLNPALQDRARELISASAVRGLTSGAYRLDPFIYTSPVPKLGTDVRPWSRVSRVRNAMLDAAPWRDYQFVFWADADVIDYSPELPLNLATIAPDGIAAPMIFVEEMDATFYDWAAFVIAGQSHVRPDYRWHVIGRNLNQTAPYWPVAPLDRVVNMDCVGTCYSVNTAMYRDGARHQDHPAFTDHWPICSKAREMGRPVVVCRDLVAMHANLPKWGHTWH